MIAIVDYDMGNVASVANMLKRVGAPESVLTRDPDVLRRADKVILPGVGAFDKGMRNLAEFGLLEALNEAVIERRVPILGICLGMHLLTKSSEEGQLDGLGWIDAQTVRFRFPENSGLKVPHIGWNYVEARRGNPLIPAGKGSRFYFVHGYYVTCNREEDTIGMASYGFDFACAVNHDNVFGVQFHPEKSHRFGMALLDGFVRL
ncbi:MAG: imidazole glycerol phosphate synthase subunit HisH [Gemmatimonadaceae bacterium]